LTSNISNISYFRFLEAYADATAVARDEVDPGLSKRCDNTREIVADGRMRPTLEIRDCLT
jgi:CRISPR/Cas system-associated exonuclease Cas4 (RecB family)